MDPQVTQQLTQLVQQMLQVLQSAGGGAAPDPMAGGAPPAMDDGGPEDDMDAPMDKDMMNGGGAPMMDDDDDDMAGGGDMMGGASLHDRVQKLEAHTGLRKAASPQPITDRVDALERHWLGEEYEGPMPARVAQLEKAANIIQKTPTRSAQRPQQQQDDAPDVIPLGALIKTAIAEGVKEAVKQMPQSADPGEDDDTEELPSLAQMRKAARNAPRYAQRKAQAHTVQSDEDLMKTAEAWGYDEAELDQPVGLGDLLMAQWQGLKNGSPILVAGDDD